MDIFADLHTHTTESDGTTEPEDVVKYAKENNLQAIAITDHDTVHQNTKPLDHKEGIDIIYGIELRVNPQHIPDTRIDLLGYGCTPTNRLKQVLDQLQENRKQRVISMLDLIENETGVRVEVELTGSVGRGNVGRAIEDCERLDYTYEEAFNSLIGTDCPCYLQREIPSFEYGLELLQETCEFVSLAHPYRYTNSVVETLKLGKHLDGIEVNYPYQRKEKHGISAKKDSGYTQLAVNWFDLLATGGSDAHRPSEIGANGVTEKQYRDFLAESNLEYYSGFESRLN